MKSGALHAGGLPGDHGGEGIVGRDDDGRRGNRRSRWRRVVAWRAGVLVTACLVPLTGRGVAGETGTGEDPPGAEASDDRRPSQQEWMTARGFVRHKGAWRTPQEITLLERHEQATVARKQWGPKLEKLRRRLDDPGTAAEAAEALREIADPAAVPALAAALPREPVAQVRAWMIEALSRIGSPEAFSVIVQAALDHPDADTRATATERLARVGPRLAEPVLVAALAGPDNARLNRAAEAIGTLGLASAVPALVEALETEHVVATSDGSQPGQTSVTFGNGGGEGLALGGGPKRSKVRVRNEAVLAALERITGQDFRWNEAAWRQWVGSRDTEGPIDLRRSLPAVPPADPDAAAAGRVTPRR